MNDDIVLKKVAKQLGRELECTSNKHMLRSSNITSINDFFRRALIHLVRGRLMEVFRLIKRIIISNKFLDENDPYNTFDYLMNISEQGNVKSAFYFICGKSSNIWDPI